MQKPVRELACQGDYNSKPATMAGFIFFISRRNVAFGPIQQMELSIIPP